MSSYLKPEGNTRPFMTGKFSRPNPPLKPTSSTRLGTTTVRNKTVPSVVKRQNKPVCPNKSGPNFSTGSRSSITKTYNVTSRGQSNLNLKPGSSSRSRSTVVTVANRSSRTVAAYNASKMSDRSSLKSVENRKNRIQTTNFNANCNKSAEPHKAVVPTKKPLTLTARNDIKLRPKIVAKTPTTRQSFCRASGLMKREFHPNDRYNDHKSGSTSGQLEGKSTSCIQKSGNVQCKSILRKVDCPDYQEKHEAGTSTKHVKFKKSKDMQQVSLRSKLNDWLHTKGRTPSHCRHLICFDAQMSAEKKKPKPVYGRLSRDILDKQENSLKKEDCNSRKRLFDGSHKPAKSPATRHFTPKELTVKTNSDSESTQHVLTPSIVSNKIPVKVSPLELCDTTSEEESENHCDHHLSNSFDGSKFAQPQLPNPDHYHELETVSPSRSQTIPDQKILDNLSSMLEECLTLYKAGCPVQNILPWLHEIDANIPQAQTFAPYYACKAEVFSGNPQQVLDILCQAVERNAQPSDVLAKAMRDLLFRFCPPSNILHPSPAPLQMMPTLSQSFVDSSHDMENLLTRQSCTSLQLQNQTDADLGSTIKYSVIPNRPLPGQTPDAVPLAKVTPIRRSFRLSNRQQTPYRKELDSMSDLTLREAEATMYQPNPALVD